jgi:hypothetical protein
MPDLGETLGMPHLSIDNAEMPPAGDAGVTVTFGAANTKGSWTEVIASTAKDVRAIGVEIWAGCSGGAMMDIGTGAAGFEAVLIPDLFLFNGSSLPGSGHRHWLIPIKVPAGTRLAARGQGAAANTAIVALCLMETT